MFDATLWPHSFHLGAVYIPVLGRRRMDGGGQADDDDGSWLHLRHFPEERLWFLEVSPSSSRPRLPAQ